MSKAKKTIKMNVPTKSYAPITVTSTSEFLNKIDSINRSIYRGQSEDWSLIPSIARYDIKELGYSDWVVFQEEILITFKKRSLPYLNKKPTSNLEWLILAQHYGTPTCLLDWTTNPLKALFFAVEDSKSDNADGVVYALEPRGWFADLSYLNTIPSGYPDALVVVFPDSIDSRVVSQESCYTVFPLKKSAKPIIPLTDLTDLAEYSVRSLKKIIVPAAAKRDLRLELRRLGITHMSLFPSIEGVAQTIKAWLGSFDDV